MKEKNPHILPCTTNLKLLLYFTNKAFGTGNEMTIILFNLGLNSKFKIDPGYDLHGSHDQIL